MSSKCIYLKMPKTPYDTVAFLSFCALMKKRAFMIIEERNHNLTRTWQIILQLPCYLLNVDRWMGKLYKKVSLHIVDVWLAWQLCPFVPFRSDWNIKVMLYILSWESFYAVWWKNNSSQWEATWLVINRWLVTAALSNHCPSIEVVREGKSDYLQTVPSASATGMRG